MKKVLISIGIIVVVAGLALGALYFIKQAQPAPAAKGPNTSKTLVLDHSKDYGACTLLDTSSIKTALGKAADNLQPSQNMGITKDNYFGTDVKDIVSDSQSCVYAFIPGGTLANSYNAVNSFSVKKTVYTNPNGPKTLINQIKSDTTNVAVSDLGGVDAAFYSADNSSKGPGATYIFELQVFKDKTSTTYMIIQPAEGATFTADSAKTGLLTLAK